MFHPTASSSVVILINHYFILCLINDPKNTHRGVVDVTLKSLRDYRHSQQVKYDIQNTRRLKHSIKIDIDTILNGISQFIIRFLFVLY